MCITNFVVSQDDIRLVQDELNSLGFIFYLVLFIIVTMAIVQIILYIKYLKSESTIPFLLISGTPVCISCIIGIVGIKTNNILIAIAGSFQMVITATIIQCGLIIEFCRLLIVIVGRKREKKYKEVSLSEQVKQNFGEE